MNAEEHARALECGIEIEPGMLGWELFDGIPESARVYIVRSDDSCDVVDDVGNPGSCWLASERLAVDLSDRTTYLAALAQYVRRRWPDPDEYPGGIVPLREWYGLMSMNPDPYGLAVLFREMKWDE